VGGNKIGMPVVKTIAYKCPHCKHEWLARGDSKPTSCAKCKRMTDSVITRPDMPSIKVSAFKCNVCNHVWLPRNKQAKPTACAKCKTPYWDKKPRA